MVSWPLAFSCNSWKEEEEEEDHIICSCNCSCPRHLPKEIVVGEGGEEGNLSFFPVGSGFLPSFLPSPCCFVGSHASSSVSGGGSRFQLPSFLPFNSHTSKRHALLGKGERSSCSYAASLSLSLNLFSRLCVFFSTIFSREGKEKKVRVKVGSEQPSE